MIHKPRITATLVVAVACAALGASAYAQHTGGAVALRDKNGADIVAGSSTPYSPKMTCGECHDYESDVAFVTKDHGPGTPTYQVPYPQHGVTAGYHFQQGRNLEWGQTQRDFYHLADFTSSGGMSGKY